MLVDRSKNILSLQSRDGSIKNTNFSLFALAIPSLSATATKNLEEVDDILKPSAAGQGDVRRPLDGMRARDDSYATLSVVLGGAARKMIANSSAKGGSSKYTANIMVQNVNHSSNEKMQLTQTFDKDRLFFFGSNLEQIQVQALVIENESFQWLKEFYENYNKFFKGTTLASEDNVVEFIFEDKTIIGYITQFSFARSSADLHQANISFSLTATNTIFNRPLKTTGRVMKFSADDAGGMILESITNQLANSSEFMRRESVADPGTSLRNQVGSFKVDFDSIELLGTGFTETTGTLRESYPNEYPNISSGNSVDLVRESLQAKNSLLAVQSSPGIRETPLAFDLPEPMRTNVILGQINESIMIQQLNIRKQRELDAVYASEDLLFGVKFETWTPPAIDVKLTQLKNVGTSLAYLAASAVVGAATTEAVGMLTGGDFSASRMGSNMSMRVFGEDISDNSAEASNRNLTGVI